MDFCTFNNILFRVGCDVRVFNPIGILIKDEM